MSQPSQTPTPEQAAQTPAADRYRHSLDQDYAISMLMEIQKGMGVTEQSLKTMTEDVKELKKSSARVEKIIYASVAVITIVGGIAYWSFNTAKEFFLLTYKASLEQQQKSASPPTPPTTQRRN